MNIVIIIGSHRGESQSSKVGRFLEKVLLDLKHSVSVIDLRLNPLPLWDEGVWDKEERWGVLWRPIAAKLLAADGAIILSPEWSGMVPAGLKNFFLFVGNELAHKPGLIVAVSSGRGGAYPVVELRMSSYKNTRINYIPDHVIVRDVENVLNDHEPVSEGDSLTRERLRYSCRVLSEYARALSSVRASGVIDTKTFPVGM